MATTLDKLSVNIKCIIALQVERKYRIKRVLTSRDKKNCNNPRALKGFLQQPTGITAT
jgi:hypothetical protein